MIRAAKVDANQKKIVESLRSIGATVIHLHQVKNAFDILVIYRGEIHVMELKSPESLPKVYDRERLEKSLSEGELKCMESIQKHNVPYHIVVTIDEALDIVLKNE